MQRWIFVYKLCTEEAVLEGFLAAKQRRFNEEWVS